MIRFIICLQISICLLLLQYPKSMLVGVAALMTTIISALITLDLEQINLYLLAMTGQQGAKAKRPRTRPYVLSKIFYLLDEIRFIIASQDTSTGGKESKNMPMVSDDGLQYGDTDNFSKALLKRLTAISRATSIAITLSRGSNESLTLLSEPALPAVKDALLHLHPAVIPLCTTTSLTNLESGFEVRGLSRFGIKFALGRKLMLTQGSHQLPALLWLCYANISTPSTLEIKLLNESLNAIQAELFRHHQVAHLSIKTSEAEQSSKQKSEFLAHMSHDIRSPLNNIRAAVQCIQGSGVQNSDNQEILDLVLRNCDALTEIVEDVLDFSKHTAGKLEARIAPFEITALVREVIEAFKPSADLKAISLRSTISADPIFVNGDQRQIRRVLSNLISNSIKYTDVGEVSITVDTPKGDQSAMAISFADTGIGMTEDELRHIFEPYTRFSQDKIGGVGLGLALTKILIEISGGKIQVKSTPGKGSSFIVDLPLVESMASMNCQWTKRLRPTKILMVDDDTDFLQTTARTFTSFGHIIDSALSVQDALNKLKSSEYDLILADAHIASGGAEKLLKYVSSISKAVRTIVVTGDCDSKLAEKLLGLGAERILLKPIKDDLLVTAFL